MKIGDRVKLTKSAVHYAIESTKWRKLDGTLNLEELKEFPKITEIHTDTEYGEFWIGAYLFDSTDIEKLYTPEEYPEMFL